jgi:hypothetical protein
MKYAIIEKYDSSIHGNNCNLLNNNYICLDTKDSNLSIFEYHEIFENYIDECKERNSLNYPFFTIIEEIVIDNYHLAVNKVNVIKKIQRLWRNYKKKFTVKYLYHRQINFM